MSKIKMVVVSYLLFVFTLIIFIRTQKNPVEKTTKNNENKIRKREQRTEKKQNKDRLSSLLDFYSYIFCIWIKIPIPVTQS